MIARRCCSGAQAVRSSGSSSFAILRRECEMRPGMHNVVSAVVRNHSPLAAMISHAKRSSIWLHHDQRTTTTRSGNGSAGPAADPARTNPARFVSSSIPKSESVSATMSPKKTAPAGEWVSPITSDPSSTTKLASVSFDSQGRLYWLEGRPSEAGRQVLVTRDADGHIRDITPGPESGLYVRTSVHEYGGGDYMVADDAVFFSNFKDQRMYRQALPDPGSTAATPAAAPMPVTPEGQGLRFSDYTWDAKRSRVLAVAERHDEADAAKVDNFLVAIDPASGAMTPLVSGHDFFSNPRVSPDGSQLSWLCWDFPNMPWDGTQLMVAELREDGSVGEPVTVAGGPDEAVQQPVWSPDGACLYFISDISGWWNIYCWRQGQVSLVHGMAADFGWPLWTFGVHTYHVFSCGHVLALYQDPQETGIKMALISPGAKTLTKLDSPFTYYGPASALFVYDGGSAAGPDGLLNVAVVGGSPTQSPQVALLRAAGVQGLASRMAADWESIRRSSDSVLDPGYLSVPECVAFPTEGGQQAYLLHYPPTNKDYQLPEGQAPPLMVLSHGGPTSRAAVTLNLSIQFLTSRGFAVADVDYGGSTGYGREYRNRLRGSWGIVDVADCSAAALHLARQGLADPKRLCISGASAGGYSTLACLAFRDTFAAGASLYGVADMELLAKETHKFESRYLDLLVGPYPEAREVYLARSPLQHVEKFNAPIIFFQGDEDAVVPPDQAIKMHEAVRARGLPTALVMFKGEQHGFRQAHSIRMSLEGQLYFLGRLLGFTASMPADLEVFPIDNLDKVEA